MQTAGRTGTGRCTAFQRAVPDQAGSEAGQAATGIGRTVRHVGRPAFLHALSFLYLIIPASDVRRAIRNLHLSVTQDMSGLCTR